MFLDPGQYTTASGGPRDNTTRYGCWEANTRTVIKHFTGDGGGKRPERKERVIAECHARGWKPETEDEADALAILDYARHCLGDRTAAPAALLREAG